MSVPSQCCLCKAGPDQQHVVTRHVYGGKRSQAFYHCEICDVNYLFPQLSPEEEVKFYAAEFSKFMTSRAGSQAGWEQPEQHVAANDWMQRRRMEYMRPRLPKTGKVLEIGCASGFMLYALAEEGYACVGVEPSGVFGEFVRSKGLDCFDSFEDLRASPRHRDGFDVIVHAYVMEHIADPYSFLKGQLEMLKPNGSLFIEIPNAADALLTIYDVLKFERFYWHVGHHWYFTRKSLEYLLGKIGLSYNIILDQRYDLSNHMVWALEGKPGGMSRFSHLFGEEIENQYRQALLECGHCDTLIGVIKKQAVKT